MDATPPVAARGGAISAAVGRTARCARAVAAARWRMIFAMRAIIVAVGSELLGTDRLDTNSLKLTARLLRHGVALRRKVVVGDDEAEIAAELGRALADAELVVVSGGLGPTADDVTREAAARALGVELVFDESILRAIERRFERMQRRMPEVNRRQAFVLAGGEVLPNPRGTAPGLRFERDGRTLVLLPGVPVELEGFLEREIEPWLAARSGGVALETATLRVACVPESEVEELLVPAYAEFGREWITVLASPGDVRVRLTAAGAEGERRARLAAMAERTALLLGETVYGRREEDDLETLVGALLRGAGATLATAESCTGGMIAERVTAVAGSSDYFVGGVVAYSNELKRTLVDVPEALLREHGAVSEPVARALAEGVCRRLGASHGIGVTGIAGPGGGTPEKPVGTVHVAVATRGGETVHRVVRLPGDRERVRRFTSQLALEMLRRRLVAAAEEATPATTGRA